MTTLWMLLALVLALGAGLGMILRRILRPAASDPNSTLPGELLSPSRCARKTYQPMNRLMAEADFAFVASQAGCNPDLVTRLRRQRVRVLRLYLKQLRGDFERVYRLARRLAPGSLDPEFASRITLQALRFQALWMGLQARCALGWFVPLRVETATLVSALEHLREVARVSVLAAQPQSQPA